MAIHLSCPHCHRTLATQEDYAGKQVRCPSCGSILDVPGSAEGGSTPPSEELADPGLAPPPPDDDSDLPPIPMEVEGQGLFARVFATWKQVMFEPADFFQRMPREGALGPPIVFMLCCAVPGMIVTTLVQVGFNALPALVGAPGGPPNPMTEFIGSVGLPLLLVIAVVGGFFCGIAALLLVIFLYGAIYHIGVLLGGGAGYLVTVRIYAYSMSTQIFNVIPCIGPLVAFVWQMFILYHGFRNTHGLSTGWSVFTILIPLILGCLCGGIFFASLIAMAASLGA